MILINKSNHLKVFIPFNSDSNLRLKEGLKTFTNENIENKKKILELQELNKSLETSNERLKEGLKKTVEKKKDEKVIFYFMIFKRYKINYF
jgi:regulator of replication initiation timing